MARSRTRQINLAVSCAVVVGLFAAANYFGGKYFTQFDWTKERRHTLSEQTKSVLNGLEQPVEFVSFMTGETVSVDASALQDIGRLLEAYRAQNSSMVSLELLDPVRDPARAAELLSEFGLGLRDQLDLVVIRSGERSRQIRVDEMVETVANANPMLPPTAARLTAESALTGAIMAVTRAERPVVTFVVGHGERARDDYSGAGVAFFAETLARADYDVREWQALGSDAVPSETHLLIVTGPREPWLESESKALDTFLADGGRALVWLDVAFGRDGSLTRSGLEAVFERRGVTLEAAIAVDPDRAISQLGPESFFVELDSDHPIAAPLGGRTIITSLGRPLTPVEVNGYETAALMESSDGGWGETSLSSNSELERDESDVQGPLTLAAAVESTTSDERLIVFGDVDLIINAGADLGANFDIAMNSVNYLVGEERALAIPPRERTVSRLMLSRDQLFGVELVTIIGFPLIAIATGLSLWWSRRRARSSA